MPKAILLAGLLIILIVLASSRVLPAMTMNGFDLDNTLIPADLIKRGGLPRDGIPSIDEPEFISAGKAAYLNPDDRILGIHYRGMARAYPVRIMDWHEIVNDEFDGVVIVVTYCPLCGTGMAFRTEAPVQQFGVSGLLYNSDVLLYDRETESLWSQIMGQAVSGPQLGKKLDQIILSHTTWQDWLQRYPHTKVLSTDTGYKRNYNQSPYIGYADSSKLWFPVAVTDDRYHAKEWILGVSVNGVYKAYPFAELRRTKGVVHDKLDGVEIEVRFDAENNTTQVLNASGKEIPAIMAYWFAWVTFHPDTRVYKPAFSGRFSSD